MPWMEQRHPRQRLRFAPGVVAAEALAGQAAVELPGVLQAALAQVLPEALGLLRRQVAEGAQLRVGAVVAGHRDQQRAALGQRHQLLHTVAPVADAAVQRKQDHRACRSTSST